MENEKIEKLIDIINNLKDGEEIISDAEKDMCSFVDNYIREKHPEINFKIFSIEKRVISIRILCHSTNMETQYNIVKNIFKEFNEHVTLFLDLQKCYTQKE